MITRLIRIACKRALGSLLLALLLVLTLAPAIASASGCTMKCSRKGTACCCRKSAGPNTISARTCPAGCCQPNTIRAFAFTAIIRWASATSLAEATALLTALWVPPLFALLCFALSQRPPPSSLLRAR